MGPRETREGCKGWEEGEEEEEEEERRRKGNYTQL